MDDKNQRSKVTLVDQTDDSKQEQRKVDENVVRDVSPEVSMEASILSDDVMRAGGFGARDDMSSFLPVASDSTDFEASLRDAREYEDPQEEIKRPGLGWAEPK